MNLQRTLKQEVSLTGIGLHSGREVRVRILPASVNQGVLFRRSDLDGSPWIPAHHSYVVCTRLATTIGIGSVTVSTVEHLMAAFHGLGIDNARVEVSGPEVPILDGSSAVFTAALLEAGIETQSVRRPMLILRKRIEVREGEKWGFAEPSARLEVQGSIEWDHPMIGHQEFHYVEGRTAFSELASARTFCQLKDVEAMKKAGLARGGSLENALVVDDHKVVNPEGLRYSNEFARHKVLDALGDFKLAGISIQGFFRLHRAGHDLHSKLIAEILSHSNNYEIIGGNRPEAEVWSPVALAKQLYAVG